MQALSSRLPSISSKSSSRHADLAGLVSGHGDDQIASGVQPLHRPYERSGSLGDPGTRGWCCTGGGDARLRQVPVDLATHPLDLLMYRGGEFRLTGSRGPLALLRQDGQRCLQSVREVAGSCHRPHHPPFALLEQRLRSSTSGSTSLG